MSVITFANTKGGSGKTTSALLLAREIAELLNAKSRRKKAPAQYRNPENARQTWSGRGPAPSWFTEAPDKSKLKIQPEPRK